MTTLEGYDLWDYLIKSDRTDTISSLFSCKNQHPIPEMTINTWAKQCAENDEATERASAQEATTAACPLLENNQCTVYPVRPLACRIMLSQKDCRTSGMADMDPLDLTINNVMMQFIEHIDQNGLTGHMFNIMTHLSQENHRILYTSSKSLETIPGLLQNQPLAVLMVPPEHRQWVSPVLQKLNPAMGAIF